ncbi:MAG: hypothetical protein QMB53_04730 [Eubacteriales bacterium]
MSGKRIKRRHAAPEWLKLDNAGKIYPATRSFGWMAVYRLSVTLDEPVDETLLNQALKTTVKRLPYFAYRLRRGLFWFYLEQQEGVPRVQPDAVNPCLPFSPGRDGHFMFRVRVHDCRVAVEIFHVLADGTGTMTFLLTLIAEYLRLKYTNRIPAFAPYILDCRDKPKPGEWEDSFPVYARDAARPRGEEAAYPLRGTPAERDYLQVTIGMMDSGRLAAAAKTRGATINTYLAALILQALVGIAKEDKRKGLAKRPVKLSMPVNLRKYYKSSTLRNFSSYINVPVYADYGEYSLDDIIALVKHSMGYETAEQLINARFSSNVHAEQSKAIRPVPLVIKTLILRMMYALTGERYFTSVLSNMGRIDLPEGMRGHVKRLDFIIGAGRSNPLSIGCVSVNGQTYLSFSRTIKEPEVERRVLSALIREGVPVVVESNRRINR